MAKITSFGEKKYIKSVNELPKSYSITVNRNVTQLTYEDRNWEEEFDWSVDSKLEEHPFGYFVLFNHLLSMLDSIQASNPTIRAEMLAYIKEEFSGELL